MALYEHIFLARQDISAQQVDALVEQYKGVIESFGGKVGRIENWGLKSLTYRIKKNRKAHYALMDIDAPAAAIHEVERQMRINEDILRYMTIAVEAHEEGPSAMMQKRDRDDRPRRDGDDRGPRRDFGDRGPRPDRGPREGGFERRLEILNVGSGPLVEDDQVHFQPARAPVFHGLQQLVGDPDVFDIGDAQQAGDREGRDPQIGRQMRQNFPDDREDEQRDDRLSWEFQNRDLLPVLLKGHK